MYESWRWFGPNDPVSLNDIRQTGATDIVSALHHIPTGEVWPVDSIRQHQSMIETCEPGVTTLKWSVVESIPVHEDIKLAKPGHQTYIDNWVLSMQNLAQCGIKTICYNFMPVIDWTRTDLKYQLPNGAYTLRFDQNKFAAFDLFILKREQAKSDYSEVEIALAREVFDAMSDAEKTQLTNNIIAGLPGKMTESYGLDDFRAMLTNYDGISSDDLRNNLFAFLSQVLPHAEALGIKLALSLIHISEPTRPY